MIGVSTLVMFGLMYLNTYALDHVFFSQTRAWMALVMGATMAIIMLLFMLGMYADRRANIGIFIGTWMKAMIPHHSIAILTSERAHISDPRVRKLASGIIETRRKEIAEMKALLKDLENKR